MVKRSLLVLILLITQSVSAYSGDIGKAEEFIRNNIGKELDSFNIVIAAMPIWGGTTCNRPKINGMFAHFQKSMKDVKTVMVVETDIPEDAYSVKRLFNSDYFYKDTLYTFSHTDMSFSNFFIMDKMKNIFVLNFWDNFSNFDILDNLINAPEYLPERSISLPEDKEHIFSYIYDPFLLNNNMVFRPFGYDGVLSFELNDHKYSEYFMPTEEKIIPLLDIEPSLVDTLKAVGFFDGLYELFSIISMDYNYSENALNMLVNKSTVEIEESENDIPSLIFRGSRGLFTIDNDNKYTCNDISYRDYNNFGKIASAAYSNLLEITHYSDSEISEALPIIVQLKNYTKISRHVLIGDLNLATALDSLDINELIDFIDISETDEFCFLSQITGKIYFYGNELNSYDIGGILSIGNGFNICDIAMINRQIHIAAIADNGSRLILQSYSYSGELEKELIYSLPGDYLLDTKFIKNNNNSIILLNKWRYKRWTIDYLL